MSRENCTASTCLATDSVRRMSIGFSDICGLLRVSGVPPKVKPLPKAPRELGQPERIFVSSDSMILIIPLTTRRCSSLKFPSY